MTYNLRYIARIDLETTSPLAVRSGESSWVSDQLIYRDAFGMPAIRGTSIAGVLRACCPPELIHDIFGFAEKEKGQGSRLIVSAACVIGANDQCIQTVEEYLEQKEVLNATFSSVIERERVRIDHRGVAVHGGKFDEELLPTGARFRFELMLIGNEEDQANWQRLLDTVYSPQFMLGSGTRNGRGQFKVIQCQVKSCNLNEEKGRHDWCNLSSNLNKSDGFNVITNQATASESSFHTNTIVLKAKDFFQMGAGYGETRKGERGNEPVNIDQVYKKEKKMLYTATHEPTISDQEFLLLPATSIKGALAHRVAYHYNRLTKNFANHEDKPEPSLQELEDKQQESMDTWLVGLEQQLKNQLSIDDIEKLNIEKVQKAIHQLDALTKAPTGVVNEYIKEKKQQVDKEISNLKEKLLGASANNTAVRYLFGYADDEKAQRGRVIIQDSYIPMEEVKEKLFNHVKIDRFTGGAFHGALFNELTTSTSFEIKLVIHVEKETFQNAENLDIEEAFNCALSDLKTGLLPLGKGVTKGHGIFQTVTE